MSKTRLAEKDVIRAMRRAMRQGFNPYDSHSAQTRMMSRVWTEMARRDAEKAARKG